MRKPATRKPKTVSTNLQHDQFLPLNPNCELLTIEKVRTFPGYENISDELALELIDFVCTFSEILIGYMKVNNNLDSEILSPAKKAA